MEPVAAVTGFVLAGGQSSRMGRDKALLPWGPASDGRTLLEHVTGIMRAAVGNVTVVGREVFDLIPNRGPLGGLWTALAKAKTEWVLIAACDMPDLTPELLRGLAEVAQESSADAVVAETERGLHPLCAAYHTRLLPTAEASVRNNLLKMHDFLSTIRVERFPVSNANLLRNLNTPEDLLV